MGANALATAAGMKDEGLLATEPELMRLLNFDLIMHTPYRPLEGLMLVPPKVSPASLHMQ